MKRLSEYINEAKNGVIEDLKVGETIYVLCLSKSNKPVSAKITNIETSKIKNNFYIDLDKDVFGSNYINYLLLKDGAKGMRDIDIQGADPELHPIYNGQIDSGKETLQVVFGRSKEEIRDMVKGSYADKLAEMQKTADDLYNQYEAQIKKIQELTNKIYIDMSDDKSK